MICVVSLNPALDKYLRLAALRRGEHLDAEEVVASAGGKGVNVAGVLRVLGQPVRLLGFFGGPTGAYILDELRREGVETDPVAVAGLTRTAFVLVEADGVETEVVEPGAAVSAENIAALRQKLRRAAADAAVVVLSGSVPRGCPDDIYVQLLADCGPTPAIVDTSRQHLAALLAARPRCAAIKPNRREAEAALGYPLADPPAIARGLARFAACGVAAPIISDGAAGLYGRYNGQLWHAQPPPLTRVNSVGSGDAAVAGLAASLAQGADPEATLRLAAACGAANALTKECAAVLAPDLERLLPQIQVRPLPTPS
ncbi:MAG: 1-phosphofructokinase family hexose kinase [Terriglobales bacterium]